VDYWESSWVVGCQVAGPLFLAKDLL